jgi:hypothetical protein
MIKLSILYPNKPGSNLRKTEVDAGLQGATNVAPTIQFNEVKLSV